MKPIVPTTYKDKHGRPHSDPTVASGLDALEEKFYPRNGDGMKEHEQPHWGK